ncbi:hypothetical protein LZ554_003550 [Drepanopeziza brunnea f. sp. 'monogermtubi']|nr:hypothetical protein LZ554_003550 [Drepanopeziza brunnea f. sp. 'monogermtubi']
MEHQQSDSATFCSIDLGKLESESYAKQNTSIEFLVESSNSSHQTDKVAPEASNFVKSRFSIKRLFISGGKIARRCPATETKPTPVPLVQQGLNTFNSSPFYSLICKLARKLEPKLKAAFDPYQEQFPPKSFSTPAKAWYNLPTEDDGSHSWPFSETWPPRFIVDLRLHLPLVLTTILAIMVPISLIQQYAYPASQNVGNRPGYDCMHSGDFNLRGTDVNFGHMIFAQAKAIDLTWNALVGRGMQALLIFLSCKVFFAVLLHIVERNPVTYELFAAMSLAPTTTKGIRPMAHAVVINSDFRSRLMLTWLLITTVYIAITPILVDALSGYRAIQSTVLQLADGGKLDVSSGFTATAFESLTRQQPPDYDDFDTVTNKWVIRAASFELWANDTHVYYSGHYRISTPTQNTSDVYSAWCMNATTSVLFLSADHYGYFGAEGPLQLYDDSSCEAWFPLAPIIRQAYGVWNKTLLRDKDNYDGAWALGTWILYVYASVHCELFQKGRGFGTWRAIMDISASLRETIGDRNLCAYAEAELSGNIRARNMVMYKTYEGEKGDPRFGLCETAAAGQSQSQHCQTESVGRLKLDWEREYG